MDLTKQYDKLEGWQIKKLRFYAIKRNWKKYWGVKRIFLLMNYGV